MDFHSLPRRELQALCKKNRIPANMTNVAMADALRALKSVEGAEEHQAATAAVQFLSPQKPEARAGADAPRTSRRASSLKLSAASVEPKEQQASPLPRARRVAVKASEIMSLVAEGEGDKVEEKDLGAEQVVPPAPSAPIVQEISSRATRRRASKKEEAKEEGGDDAVEAITNKTPATRNGGRRTSTRRAVATSAPVEEGKEEQMVAPSRTARRTRQASKPPAGDSVAASAALRRSTRARGTVSKMSPLAPEDASQKEKDVQAIDSLDSETKLQELDVVEEKNNSDAETCPSIGDNVDQILGEAEDEQLMKELDVVQENNDSDTEACLSIGDSVNQILGEAEDELTKDASKQQEGVEVKDCSNQEHDVLALPNNESSEEVSEECDQQGELVAEVETGEICDQQEGVEVKDCSNQEDDALALPDNESSEEVSEECDQQGKLVAEVETGEICDQGCDQQGELVAEVETSEICDQDRVQQGEQVAEVETICQEEEGSHQANNSLSGLEGTPVLGLISSFEDMVISGEVAGEQVVHDEDKSLALQETKDAVTDLVVVQAVEGENFSLEECVINEDVAGNQSEYDEDESLELGEAKDTASDPPVAQEAESGNLYLEVESENLSAILTEGSGESPNALGNDDLAEIIAEVEDVSSGKNPTDLEFMLDSDVTADDAESSSFQKIQSPASNLKNLTESAGEILTVKVDMIIECAEPAIKKIDEVAAEAENTTEKHGLALEAQEADNRSENQESDANKENMTGIIVGVEDQKVKGDSESDKQNIDLKALSLRKLKSLLREKISNDNQKIEKKRSALAQIDENCLQRAS